MWVKLSDVCQGGYGVVGLPEFVHIALIRGEMLSRIEEIGEPPSFREYLAKLGMKHFMGQRYYSAEILQALERYEKFYRARFQRRLVVEQLELDTAYCDTDRVQNLPVRCGEEVPNRWDADGWYWALMLFQFLYHEKTAFLADPQTVWHGMLTHFSVDTAELAALVQLYGIQAELGFENPPPHVEKNILNRPGLSQDELARRREYFPKVVAYCIKQLEQRMF